MGKYVPPVGEAEGAAYVDESPALGRDGSAVPAAAIEWPQRELDHLIRAALLTPDPGDLTQVTQAIAKMIASAAGAYLRKGTTAVLEAGYWTKPVPLALAAGIITPDLAAGNVFTATAAINLTLAFPAGLAGRAGMMLVVIAQDATGGRTLTLAPGYKLAGGSWSTTANAVNLLWVTSDGSGTALDVVISQRGV